MSAVDVGAATRKGWDGKAPVSEQIAMLDAVAKQRSAEAAGAAPVYVPYVPKVGDTTAPRDLQEAADYYLTPRGQHPNAPNKMLLTSLSHLVSFTGFDQDRDAADAAAHGRRRQRGGLAVAQHGTARGRRSEGQGALHHQRRHAHGPVRRRRLRRRSAQAGLLLQEQALIARSNPLQAASNAAWSAVDIFKLEAVAIPKRVTMITRRITCLFALIAASTLLGEAAGAQTNPVVFPADFDKMVMYGDYRRGSGGELAYALRATLAIAKVWQPLPNGTRLVLEIYSNGALTDYFVMEKREGWGLAFSQERRTGDWRFQQFDTGRKVRRTAIAERCDTCHQGQALNDFMFTIDRMRAYIP